MWLQKREGGCKWLGVDGGRGARWSITRAQCRANDRGSSIHRPRAPQFTGHAQQLSPLGTHEHGASHLGSMYLIVTSMSFSAK
jgi:hypothetical protein